MEYRKDIAQEMLMYQTKCTNDELQSILVSTEPGFTAESCYLKAAKRYETM